MQNMLVDSSWTNSARTYIEDVYKGIALSAWKN